MMKQKRKLARAEVNDMIEEIHDILMCVSTKIEQEYGYTISRVSIKTEWLLPLSDAVDDFAISVSIQECKHAKL